MLILLCTFLLPLLAAAQEISRVNLAATNVVATNVVATNVVATNVVATDVVATDLENPRGVAVLSDGRLVVAEAGSGRDTLQARQGSGRLTLIDPERDARQVLLEGFVSYNGLSVFGTRRDEVGGLGDVLLLPDGRLLFTQDDPFPGYAPDGGTQDIGVFATDSGGSPPTLVSRRFVTANALAHDPARGVTYVAESGMNRLVVLDAAGAGRVLTEFPLLASGQQAVPAGLALAPDGGVWVALFSGSLPQYDAVPLAYMPGDARVVRLDPDTGEVTAEFGGFTTAVDVAVDEAGTLYVLELTTLWPTAPMPEDFPLHDPSAPPDPGGYPRYSGRLSAVSPAGERRTLLSGLDAPTNLTYFDGVLYISLGQGTPGRVVFGPDGPTPIRGEVWRLGLR